MNSRIVNHLQWVLPNPENQKKKKKKNYFSFKSSKGWLERKENWKPLHNPPLSPRDEAIFFLYIASEIEHSLMVQYLYAAFSLGGSQVPEDKKYLVNEWRKSILGIAREEMGHLITVQNMLHSLGGPLTFQREDFPFDSDLYPFKFTLEALTKKSLAKYVVAEMPSEKLLKKQPALLKEIQPIKKLAKGGNTGKNINRVGLIYEKIQSLIDSIDQTDFLTDSEKFQSNFSAWGTNDSRILILTANNRSAVKAALREIAEQGEGQEINLDSGDNPSHFQRFMEIYRAFPRESGWRPAKFVPVNPSTNDFGGDSAITNNVALLWAQLSNQRYRMILLYLSHSLQIPVEPDSPYGQLVSWSFGEMYNLRSISDILTTLPQGPKNAKGNFAASPFEIPYTLNLPARDVNKWRTHRDQILNSKIIIEELLEYSDKIHAVYLKALRNSDAHALEIINSLINA